jgi:hypothetical protein
VLGIGRAFSAGGQSAVRIIIERRKTMAGNEFAPVTPGEMLKNF